MSSSFDTESEYTTWVDGFLSRNGHLYFCRVSDSFIDDAFNLVGLSQRVPHYAQALLRITNQDDVWQGVEESEEDEMIDDAAEILYGLIHARFILTREGIEHMVQKWKDKVFGKCPRTFCYNQTCLPIGISELPGKYPVMLYCPRCRDLFRPDSATLRRLDGVYFGTGYAHVMFMVHPELRPSKPIQFIPRLYGFKVHSSAVDFQRQLCVEEKRKKDEAKRHVFPEEVCLNIKKLHKSRVSVNGKNR